jgi:HKD family nuclease
LTRRSIFAILTTIGCLCSLSLVLVSQLPGKLIINMTKYQLEVKLPVSINREEAEKIQQHLIEYLRQKYDDKIDVKFVTVITN